MTERIAFVLNGVRVEVQVDPMQRLADVLCSDFGLTGVKIGCSSGDCGGCTVRVDGRQQAACMVAVAQVEGCEVVTEDA